MLILPQKSQNSRMIEVGRDLWRSSGSIPLLKQGHLEPVVQYYVQTDFEYFQGQRLHHVSRQPVPVLGHPHSKEVFSNVQMESPVFHCVAIPSGPVPVPLERV